MEYTVNEDQLARLPTPQESIEVAKMYEARVNVLLGMPVVLDDNRIVTVVDWADSTLTIAAQPDVPRNLTVALTDANDSVTGLLTITGKDYKGRVIGESMQPLGDGNGKTLLGTKIFAEVTSCVITGTAGALGGTDQLIIGVGDVIGVPYDLLHANAVAFCWLGATKVTPDAVAIGESTSGIDANGGTYDGAKWLIAILQPARSV